MAFAGKSAVSISSLSIGWYSTNILLAIVLLKLINNPPQFEGYREAILFIFFFQGWGPPCMQQNNNNNNNQDLNVQINEITHADGSFFKSSAHSNMKFPP